MLLNLEPENNQGTESVSGFAKYMCAYKISARLSYFRVLMNPEPD